MAITETQIRQIVAAIYSISEFNQVAVGYYSNNMWRQLSPGSLTSPNYGRRAVILEETAGNGIAVRAPVTPPTIAIPARTGAPTNVEIQQGAQARNTLQANGSRIVPELIGAALPCGFAVISGIGVLGSVAAEILTASQLAGMNRARRQAALNSAIEQASRNPETAQAVRQTVTEAIVASGSSQRSIVGARTGVVAISQETTRRLHRSLVEVFSGYVSLPINALPSERVGSASGSINFFGGKILNVIKLAH
ncbi:MAG: hypothetical protein RLY14_2740 [Planctomycetota bacterium]|jgi:hypothetical protein